MPCQDAEVAEHSRLGEPAAAPTARRRCVRPRRHNSGWESLTEAEREVVRLVVDGLRNGEIAERLSVSRRTVESHLYRVFTKLEISSRLELAVQAVAKGQGLH